MVGFYFSLVTSLFKFADAYVFNVHMHILNRDCVDSLPYYIQTIDTSS